MNKESYEETMKELEYIMHHACASCKTRIGFSDLEDEELLDWCMALVEDEDCQIYNYYLHFSRIIDFYCVDVPMLLKTCKRYEEYLQKILNKDKFSKLVHDIVDESLMDSIENMPDGGCKDFFKDILAGSIQHRIDREKEEGDPDVFEF